eukprot:1159851-Pelagomonas_calceolata.AAC.9
MLPTSSLPPWRAIPSASQVKDAHSEGPMHVVWPSQVVWDRKGIVAVRVAQGSPSAKGKPGKFTNMRLGLSSRMIAVIVLDVRKKWVLESGVGYARVGSPDS